MATIDSKNLLVWVKAMSRGQALPLDASEIHETLAAAEAYAASAIAYEGQTIKAKLEDGKYHEFILQPSDAGYVLEEVGAIDESDLKQYVHVVEALPESNQLKDALYIVNTDGYVWTGSEWKKVFWDVSADVTGVANRVKALEDEMPNKAPLANPVFSGVVKVGDDEVALKSYVDGLVSKLESKTPAVLNAESYAELAAIEAGTTYRVAEAGTYFGHKCEIGDLILVLDHVIAPPDDVGHDEDNPNTFMVIQANIDGAVTSTADISTIGEIVVFDSVTGKVIKGSGVQIASLNDAIAKAHEHGNKAVLDSYDKSQTDLLANAKSEAQALVSAHETAVNTAMGGKADKATTLSGYGITDAYNKTETDASLKTITDNLNTKISTSDADNKIATSKEETLEEAATAASEALEARVGSIPADTTIQSYIDTAVGSGGTASAQAIAAAKQEAISSSNTYTDTQISNSLAVVEF